MTASPWARPRGVGSGRRRVLSFKKCTQFTQVGGADFQAPRLSPQEGTGEGSQDGVDALVLKFTRVSEVHGRRGAPS